jgi:radical SAM protein with 4Fe4S-binding SPASM domain
VTSYPDYRFGNIFDCDSLAALLRQSTARRQFGERPIALVQRECLHCDYLSICHGGCPVRTFSVQGTLFERDPNCRLYQTLFRHIETMAAATAARSPIAR